MANNADSADILGLCCRDIVLSMNMMISTKFTLCCAT